jgi:hypothetical protein
LGVGLVPEREKLFQTLMVRQRRVLQWAFLSLLVGVNGTRQLRFANASSIPPLADDGVRTWPPATCNCYPAPPNPILIIERKTNVVLPFCYLTR